MAYMQRKKMKRLPAGIIAVILFLLLTACNASDEKTSASQTQAEPSGKTSSYLGADLIENSEAVIDPAEYQFAVVYGGLHPYFEPYKPGAKTAAKDLGIPEPYVVSPQAWDQAEQNQVIDGVIARGAKGIAMFPSDAAASNIEITKIVDEGIPVIALGGSPAEPSDATFCFATDVGASVAYGTQKLIDKLKANGLTHGHIVHLCSALNDTNTQKRQAAIREVLSRPQNAGFTLYKEHADTDAIELAEDVISDMFSSYIDEVDGIICTGYVNAQVLAKTMIVRNEKRVVAIGIDDSQDVLDAISSGIMYGTMTQNPWGMGYVGIYALKLIKDGYTYKDGQPFFIDSGYFLLTRENISSYQEMLEEKTGEFVTTMREEYFNPPSG
jgi:ribose transport system substrate-binding protein